MTAIFAAQFPRAQPEERQIIFPGVFAMIRAFLFPTAIFCLFLMATPSNALDPEKVPQWYPEQVEIFQQELGDAGALAGPESIDSLGAWMKAKEYPEDWFVDPEKRKQVAKKLLADRKPLPTDDDPFQINKTLQEIIDSDNVSLESLRLFLKSASILVEGSLKEWCGKKGTNFGSTTCAEATNCKTDGCCAKNNDQMCKDDCKPHFDRLKLSNKSPKPKPNC